jgi:hypothetical protein
VINIYYKNTLITSLIIISCWKIKYVMIGTDCIGSCKSNYYTITIYCTSGKGKKNHYSTPMRWLKRYVKLVYVTTFWNNNQTDFTLIILMMVLPCQLLLLTLITTKMVIGTSIMSAMTCVIWVCTILTYTL